MLRNDPGDASPSLATSTGSCGLIADWRDARDPIHMLRPGSRSRAWTRIAVARFVLRRGPTRTAGKGRPSRDKRDAMRGRHRPREGSEADLGTPGDTPSHFRRMGAGGGKKAIAAYRSASGRGARRAVAIANDGILRRRSYWRPGRSPRSPFPGPERGPSRRLRGHVSRSSYR